MPGRTTGRIRAAAIAIAVAGAAVLVGGAAHAGAANRILWGNAASEHGEVCLDLPAGIVDWRGLALEALGPERFAHPSPDVLRPGLAPEYAHTVSVPFEARVPESVAGRFWLVLYRGGAAPVIPTLLRGSVGYSFDDSLTLTAEPAVSGVACAPGRTPEPAAFFVSGVQLGDATLDEIPVSAAGKDTFAIAVDGQEHHFPRPSFAFPRVVHVTLFHADPIGAVALVEWAPGDGSNCQSAFSLLVLPAARGRADLLENGYDCDL